MSCRWRFITGVLFLTIVVVRSNDVSIKELEIRMPPRPTTEEDTYLCVSVQLPSTPTKLIEVKPEADQTIVHHILLMGCQSPVKLGEAWNCKHQPICHDRDSVIYGWGRNAARVKYPDGVAFSVGEGTNILALTLQVHYLSIRPDNDQSGVVVKLANRPSEMTASTMMYASMFTIPPEHDRYPVENDCCYSGFEPITTVAFRVHTHEMGRSVYMTKTSGLSPNGFIIAERDPLLPQGFIPVKRPVTIFPGERLKTTCEFYSLDKNETVSAGPQHGDEMCNMYMVIASEVPYFGNCFGQGYFLSSGVLGSIGRNNIITEESKLSNFWKTPSSISNNSIGQTVSVQRGHDGKIWILHRGDRKMDMRPNGTTLHVVDRSLVTKDVVLVVNPKTGQIESSWGSNFFSVPHMLSIGYDESIWITDVGKHQVFKFSPDGQLLLTLGEEFVPGKGPGHFCAPTKVAVLTDGTVLISDGYCNKRVVRFSAEGDYLTEIEDLELALPHAVIADECNDVFYVADREQREIVCYHLPSMTRLYAVTLEQRAMSLARGPFQTFLALAWDRPNYGFIYQFKLVNGEYPVIVAKWEILSSAFPHDLTLSAAPVELTEHANSLSMHNHSNQVISAPNTPQAENDVLVAVNGTEDDIHVRADIKLTSNCTDDPRLCDSKNDWSSSTPVNRAVFHADTTSIYMFPHVRVFLLLCTFLGLAVALYYLKKRPWLQSV